MQLEDFINALPIPVCVIDSSELIVNWNSQIALMSSLSEKDVVGKPIIEVLPSFGNVYIHNRLEMVLEGGAPALFSSELHPHLLQSKQRDGSLRHFYTYVNAVNKEDSDSHLAIITFFDRTRTAQMLTELLEVREVAIRKREASEQAREAELRAMRAESTAEIEHQRLHTVQQLATTIAHEFNNPLAVIKGAVDLMELNPEIDKSVLSSNEKIKKHVFRMQDLVEKLMKIERLQEVDYAVGLKILDLHNVALDEKSDDPT
jgi:PAS domain S-box-containing protein